MKNILIGVIVIIVLGGLGFYIVKNKDASNYGGGSLLSQNTETSQTPTTTALKEKTYTLADFSTHNSKESCWSVINGKVYDLTPWVSKHPGGESAILSICGKDGTDNFLGKHEGDEKPEAKLATFYIGVLAQ
ncbi:MAG: nitrate reductase [Parcubacteria group bacterium LiPW_30]|nr:MAG: nitrate reductase [Parcubacteria group bacterium LiPW_30]